MADQLATPSDLASLLQKDVDTASATLAVEVCTAVVQAAADGQRILQVVGDTEVIDLEAGFCGSYLKLSQQPVTAVTSVLIGLAAVTDFIVQYSKGRLWRLGGWQSTVDPYWPVNPSTVTVVYTHGYASGDQRLQLARGAVLSLARGLFDNPSGAASEKIDDYAVTYAAAEAALEAAPALKKAIRKQYGPKARMVRVL